MSTPAEDIEALRAAVINVLHDTAFDDMEWPEIFAALDLVKHDVKIVFCNYGNFNNAPPPEVPPEART